MSEAADPVAQAPEETDLGRLQRALLGGPKAALSGDGTLRILQGEGPWEAAALATVLRDDQGVWLLSGEHALLDLVRSRFDRPRLGIGTASRWRPALQVLPLVLALQTGPQDPQTALELLTLPISPVPRGMRKALVTALSNQPAVGSPLWNEALEGALAKHGERYPDADIDMVRARINTMLPIAPAREIDAAKVVGVIEAVEAWLRAVGGMREDPILLSAGSVALDMARSLRRLPPDRPLDRLQLAQLHDIALGDGVATETEAEAGAPAACEAPEAIPGGVKNVTWFGLVAGNAEVGREIVWTDAEQEELVTAGVSMPEEGEVRANEQASWLNAVLAPCESLTLVTWETAGAEPAEPHPLLDLWTTRLEGEPLEKITTKAAEFLAQDGDKRVRLIPLAAPVTPRAVWRLPANLVSTRRRWSALSIESLITCPMKYTLTYAAGLRPGATAALPDLRILSGSFAHALFESLFFEEGADWGAMSPERARERLHQLFDERVETEAVTLALPAQDAFTKRLRRQLSDAAAELVNQLKAGKWIPEAPEKEVADLGGKFSGQDLTGQIDLLVCRDDGKRAVVDLKLGGANYRRKTLRNGTSIQLAVYAKAVAGESSLLPPVAYFILEDGELVTTDNTDFPQSAPEQGPNTRETLDAAESAWSWWRDAVNAGLVIARGGHSEEEPDLEELAAAVGRQPPEHPWDAEKPSCHFCDAARLCQFSNEGGAR